MELGAQILRQNVTQVHNSNHIISQVILIVRFLSDLVVLTDIKKSLLG